MKNINIYLTRHGQSVINAIPDMIGQEPTTPLTDKGKDQAKKVGHRYLSIIRHDPHLVISSSYKRAYDTCMIAAKESEWFIDGEWECPFKVTDDLVEYNPGEWKGSKRSELYSKPNLVEKLDKQHMGFLFPKGESLHQVSRRAASYLEENIIYNKEILELAEKEDLHIPVFSHGQTIKCLLHYIMGFDQSFLWKISLENTSICHVVYNDKGWFLKSINDFSHLK